MDFVIMVPLIFVYTLIVLWLGYTWGTREKYMRAESFRSSPPLGRHAAGYQPEALAGDPGPGSRLPARHVVRGDVPEPPARPAPPPSLLARVRDGLRQLGEDDPGEAPGPRGWGSLRGQASVSDDWDSDDVNEQVARDFGDGGEAPAAGTTQAEAVLPAAEGTPQ
jgi:hypothetical protein